MSHAQRCVVCNGAGQVSEYMYRIPDASSFRASGTGLVPCRSCGGTGVVWRDYKPDSESEAGRRIIEQVVDARMVQEILVRGYDLGYEHLDSEDARRIIARQVASAVECIATFAAERNETAAGVDSTTLIALADAAEKWPEDALRVHTPQESPDTASEAEGPVEAALVRLEEMLSHRECHRCDKDRTLIAAARAEHTLLRAEKHTLEEALRIYADRARKAEAELAALGEGREVGEDEKFPRKWMCSICFKTSTESHGETCHFVCASCYDQVKERGEGRVVEIGDGEVLHMAGVRIIEGPCSATITRLPDKSEPERVRVAEESAEPTRERPTPEQMQAAAEEAANDPEYDFDLWGDEAHRERLKQFLKDVREWVLDVLAEERNSERGRDATLRDLAYEQQRVDEDLFKVLWEDFGMAPDEDLAPGGIELKRRLRAIVGADDTPQESDTVPAELVQELVKALALMGNPPKSTQDSLFAAHGFLRALAKVKECLG